MRLRLQNSKEDTLRVVLEPWASEVMLKPGESVWVVADGTAPIGASFDVESHDYGLVVTPEWENALAHFCDEAGNRVDSDA